MFDMRLSCRDSDLSVATSLVSHDKLKHIGHLDHIGRLLEKGRVRCRLI